MRKYEYIILNNDTGERKVLQNAPVGWDSQKINIIRDLTYFGVFKNLSVEFEFVGDGYKYIQTEYLRRGVDSDLIIRIYRLGNFEAQGKINFAQFNDNRRTRHFKVDIIQSSFVQDFNNREDVKLNILNNISLDRKPVTATPARSAEVRGKVVKFTSEFEGPQVAENIELYHHLVPFKLKINDNPDVKEVSNFELSHNVDELLKIENAIIANTTPINQTVIVNWQATFNVAYVGFITSVQIEGLRIRTRMYLCNSDNSIASTLFNHQIQSDVNKGLDGDYTLTYPATATTLAPGQYIVIDQERFIYKTGVEALSLDLMTNSFKTKITWSAMSMFVIQDSAFPNTRSFVFLPHELFTNIIAQITGKENAVYSDFFGREELGYAENGPGAFLGITTGGLLREITLTESQVATSLRDAFVSYNAVYNLGLIIRGGVVHIEPKISLFSSEVVYNIGEVSDLDVGPSNEFLFNSVLAGYPKAEYEEQNGRDEFNTEAQYTNSLRTAKKNLDIRSVYRGDGYGIEFARRQALNITGTKDTKYDDKIFLIDLILDGNNLKTRRLENIDSISGVYDTSTVINARIAPGQNLLRWQNYLGIPLHRKASTNYYFQTKDKNARLDITTAEGQSVDQQDLTLNAKPFFLPEEKTFKSQLPLEALFAIMNNPLGIITYTYHGEKFYDFLFEVDAENEKATAKWKMLSTRPTPSDTYTQPDVVSGDYLKYGNGIEDFVKYGNGVDDYIMYK